MKQFMMSRAKDNEVDTLLKHYPDNQRAGSPFDTGKYNVIGRFLVRIGLIRAEVCRQVNSSGLRLSKGISFSIAHVDCCCRTWLESRNHGDSVRVRLHAKELHVTDALLTVHKRGKHLPYVGAVWTIAIFLYSS